MASASSASSSPRRKVPGMDFRLEVVVVPVSDVDRAKAFYADQVGFNVDHDNAFSDELRVVQLTPPGSACSIKGAGCSRQVRLQVRLLQRSGRKRLGRAGDTP